MSFLTNLSHIINNKPEFVKTHKLGQKVIFWEKGIDEPSVSELTELATACQVSLDQLVNGDITDGNYISGEQLRVLATTVDSDNNENIELVPVKAKAGYACGYGDPDYLKVLPAFQLPFLSRDKKYRSFEIEGDSMPPLANGDYVTGEFIRNWNFIKDGYPYILVTKNEGIVFKIIINQIAKNNTLKLFSTNPIYKPYELPVGEVLEVWKFVNYISNEAPELKIEQLNDTMIKVV